VAGYISKHKYFFIAIILILFFPSRINIVFGCLICVSPPEPAQFVLEVNAGFVENKNINIGAEAILNNIK